MKRDKEDILVVNTFGFYLHRALNTLIKRLNSAFKERGIDLQHAQYVILKTLWTKDGLSQNDLVRCLGKDPAAISRAISYLQSKGYVERRPINGSTTGVYLSEKAILMKPQIEEVADAVTELGLQGIHDNQRKMLVEMLTNIYNSTKQHINHDTI